MHGMGRHYTSHYYYSFLRDFRRLGKTLRGQRQAGLVATGPGMAGGLLKRGGIFKG